MGGVSRRWLEQSGLTLEQETSKASPFLQWERLDWGLKSSSGDLYFFQFMSTFASYSFLQKTFPESILTSSKRTPLFPLLLALCLQREKH